MVVVETHPAGAPRVYHRGQTALHPKTSRARKVQLSDMLHLFDFMEAESDELK